MKYDFDADRVRDIRLRLGETQVVFAQRLGVTQKIVSRWENGVSRPTWGRVLKALLDAEAEVTV